MSSDVRNGIPRSSFFIHRHTGSSHPRGPCQSRLTAFAVPIFIPTPLTISTTATSNIHLTDDDKTLRPFVRLPTLVLSNSCRLIAGEPALPVATPNCRYDLQPPMTSDARTVLVDLAVNKFSKSVRCVHRDTFGSHATVVARVRLETLLVRPGGPNDFSCSPSRSIPKSHNFSAQQVCIYHCLSRLSLCSLSRSR